MRRRVGMQGRRSFVSIFSISILIVLCILGFVGFPVANADLTASSGEKWAIIAGVSDYLYSNILYGLDDLEYCDKDAIDLSNLIIPTWGSSHVKLLTESEANKTIIHDAIFNWLDPLEDSDDTVLFFFSGHGGNMSDEAPIDEADGKDEVICPHDYQPSPFRQIHDEIRDDELDNWLSVLESGRIVVMLDTCHSGGFIDSIGTAKALTSKTAAEMDDKTSDFDDGFAKDISQGGRVILTASAETESSWLYEDLEHGVFSYYIIEALGKLDVVNTNGNNEISAEEIFHYAEPRIIAYAAQHEDSQHPQLYDGYSGELPLIIAASISFDSNPRATLITVDGVTYSPSKFPKPFTWAKNTTHTFNVSSQAYI